jgi:hypothetical protein
VLQFVISYDRCLSPSGPKLRRIQRRPKISQANLDFKTTVKMVMAAVTMGVGEVIVICVM